MSDPAVDDDPVDVFALPVHPWAAMFPMFDDDRLDDLTESVRRRGGLLVPVTIGMAPFTDGGEPVLCLIDGRNRVEACRRAGVKPDWEMLPEGMDPETCIAIANLDRRSLSKGQRAMIIALCYPEQRTYPGSKSESKTSYVSKSISPARVSQARAVVRFCPQFVQLVRDGEMGLDEAYAEASRRKLAQQDVDVRMQKLRAGAPDIADLVVEGRLSLDVAEDTARERRRADEKALRDVVQLVGDMDALVARMNGDRARTIARLWRMKRDHFGTSDLDADLSLWIKALGRVQDALREATDEEAAS